MFRLEMYIFKLKIYVFSLEIKNVSGCLRNRIAEVSFLAVLPKKDEGVKKR